MADERTGTREGLRPDPTTPDPVGAPEPAAARDAAGATTGAADAATRARALEYLSRVELLRGVDDASLARLVRDSHEVALEPGAWLLHEGDTGEAMYVILDGELDVSVKSGNVQELVARRAQGEVVGELALLGRTRRAASVRAATPARLLEVDRAAFEDLLTCPGVAATIYRTSLEREHGLVALLARREKLAALGTMSAGLAHELNNPAAALRRTALELDAAHARRDAAAVALFGGGLAAGELQRVLELGDVARRRFEARAAPGATDPEREEALLEAVEELGLESPWEAAAALADAGWAPTELAGLLAPFREALRAPVVEWLAADAACRALLREMAASSEAVSRLVGAVKEYSHLDRAPLAEVDVEASLENSLLILGHRLRKTRTTVVRRYAQGLPRLEGFPSELSQVWTNLIDNALDAMGEGGTLTLSTHAGTGQVTVEVSDDGPGVPDEVKPRLFEPFLSTKGVGEGTGLGLYVAKEIVTQRHGGSLGFESRPGATTFRVTLPLRGGARHDAPATDAPGAAGSHGAP